VAVRQANTNLSHILAWRKGYAPWAGDGWDLQPSRFSFVNTNRKGKAMQWTIQETEEIQTLLEKKSWGKLRAIIIEMPVPDASDLLLTLPKQDRVVLFRLMPREQAGDVFAYLERSDRDNLLEALTDEETRNLLAELSPDERTELFEEMPGEVTQKLLNLLNKEDLKETRLLLGYPEESVGRLMTPDYVAVRSHWTVERVLKHIRKQAEHSETLSTIYVVDDHWKLTDALTLETFVLAEPEQIVEDLMDYQFEFLSAFEDRERAVEVLQRYDVSVLPVVDSAGVLVGIVTFDDVIDVAAEEATEDFHKFAAVTPLQESYLQTNLFEIFRKRIVWLVVLVFMNVFSGAAIASFEETIAVAVALVFFMPLIMGSGGNAGAQASTLVIRALSLGDVKISDWARLLFKDIAVSLLLGIAMGLAVSTLGFIRGGPQVGLTVALTMVCVVLVGSSIGTLLPLALSKLGLDPAAASAPLITSIADISGVIIYFSIANMILGL
jgi:magnesium transporter